MILLSIPMLMLACKGVLIISRFAVFTVILPFGCHYYYLFLLKMVIGYIFFLSKGRVDTSCNYSEINYHCVSRIRVCIRPLSYLTNKSAAKRIIIANMITLCVYYKLHSFLSFILAQMV